MSQAPSIFDCNILTLYVSIFSQSAAKRGKLRRAIFGRPDIQQPNHGLRRLLCTNCERPDRGRRACERDEIPPPHETFPFIGKSLALRATLCSTVIDLREMSKRVIIGHGG